MHGVTMTFVTMTFWIFLFSPLLMAIPVALKTKSLIQYLKALFIYTVGIHLPVIIFLLSGFLIQYKNDCYWGWIDGFHVGKLVFLPLVLWASAAFYAVEIYKVNDLSKTWIKRGYYVGAMVSSICLVIGLFLLSPKMTGALMHLERGAIFFFMLMLVPLYVAAWYSKRSIQLWAGSMIALWTDEVSLFIITPFTAAALYLSHRYYSSIPQSSGCFVVTAAAKGHGWLVGPFNLAAVDGSVQPVNRQLQTLRTFESIWSTAMPRSHSAFRMAYNVIGPRVAGTIKNPWLADVVYIAIKPVEYAAALVLIAATK